MAHLGRFALLAALVLAGSGFVLAVLGHVRRSDALVESARRVAYALLAAVVTANVAMLVALLSNDFSVRYVAQNSSRETPVFFKVLALWAADNGSLLLWSLVLAGYVAAVAVRFRRERPPTLAPALGTLYVIAGFYAALVSGPARPFATLATAPADGRGPEPLLQNHPLMAVHPPFLYLGFIGFSVPFAFGVASLVTGGASDSWVALIRRWTLTVWFFLTVGLVLGALWSYQVLGWGGYWAWDPVENVALLPWLVATAFLHSVMLQEHRGIARTWNVSLVIGAFALTTFGTFLTRGNVLSSVHAFADSSLGPAYLGFLALVLLAGFGLAVWRWPQLRATARVESVASREAAFVANNVLLLVVTGVILTGTVFPLVVEAATGRQVTVGAPYFRQATAPVLAIALLLATIGPVLPWRIGSARRAARRLRVPAALGALTVLSLTAAGVRGAAAIAGIGLAAALVVSSVAEIARGVANARHGGAVGTWTAARRGRRRYGGLLVHAGLGIAAIGVVTSSAYATQTEVTATRGHAIVAGGYVLRYDRLVTERQPQRVVLRTDVTVTRAGERAATTLRPSLNLYPAASEPIGTPSIDHGAFSDLYLSVIGLERDGESATFRLFHNPGVSWLWLGGAVMAAGGAIAGWPTRRRPARSATRSARVAVPEPRPAMAQARRR